LAALYAGATISEAVIARMDSHMEITTHPELLYVYSQELRMAFNNLQYFTRDLLRIGIFCQPQYLKTEKFKQIVNNQYKEPEEIL